MPPIGSFSCSRGSGADPIIFLMRRSFIPELVETKGLTEELMRCLPAKYLTHVDPIKVKTHLSDGSNEMDPPWVAALPWTGWQLFCGLGGSFAMDCVAGFTWTGWQLSCGLRGRISWNTQRSARRRYNPTGRDALRMSFLDSGSVAYPDVSCHVGQ
jgi:hypothetical protein